jgi:two-component system, NarL family, nitrate/nitrite response regulator NarL
MIKIFIIDDHPLVIDGIKTMLRDVGYIQIVSSAKTAEEALRFLNESDEIDIILLDINLPDIDGLRLCELIREKNRTVKIIGLTYINEAGIITQLIKKGANGYLLKSMERQELIDAINQVLDNSIYLSKQANEKIVQQLQNSGLPTDGIPALTRREKEILHLLAEGFTSNDIANKLFLSSYTVDTHRKNMLQKFNVHNTHALLKIVQSLNLMN